ncbi:ABC transporter permease [Chloroflexota bacterium]
MLQRLGLLVFAAIVFGPLLALLVDSAQSLLDGNAEWLKLAIPTGRRLTLFLRSIGLAASVAVAGMILGVLAASILWRWHSGLGSRLRWLVLVLAPIPPYVHALAWSSAIGTTTSPLLDGWISAWWVQLMALAPIAVGLALIGLESVDPALINAARPARSDIGTLARVALPLAWPIIAAGGGFLFLLSLMDYSVPSLFQMNVYSLEIFAEYSASNEAARSFLLSVPLLIVAVAVVFLAQYGLRNVAQKPAWRVSAWESPPAWPTWFVCLQWLAGGILVAQIAVPLVCLIADVDSWQNMTSSVTSARSEIGFSFLVASVAAVICLPLALAVGRRLVQTDKRGKVWWFLVIAPLAIPAPLIGIGLISIWNRPMFVDVYGSSAMPVLASLARFASLAAIVMVAQLRRNDPLLIDAARLLQRSSLQTWIWIRLPLLAPGLLAAAGIVFALTMGELGATLLVAPPGQATLTMRIYNFLHYGASSDVAGLCLMMVAIAMAAGLLAAVTLSAWSRFSPRAGVR